MPFLILFIVLPILELTVMIKVGTAIGAPVDRWSDSANRHCGYGTDPRPGFNDLVAGA